jgi:hypothetical protein
MHPRFVQWTVLCTVVVTLQAIPLLHETQSLAERTERRLEFHVKDKAPRLNEPKVRARDLLSLFAGDGIHPRQEGDYDGTSTDESTTTGDSESSDPSSDLSSDPTAYPPSSSTAISNSDPSSDQYTDPSASDPTVASTDPNAASSAQPTFGPTMP